MSSNKTPKILFYQYPTLYLCAILCLWDRFRTATLGNIPLTQVPNTYIHTRYRNGVRVAQVNSDGRHFAAWSSKTIIPAACDASPDPITEYSLVYPNTIPIFYPKRFLSIQTTTTPHQSVVYIQLQTQAQNNLPLHINNNPHVSRTSHTYIPK